VLQDRRRHNRRITPPLYVSLNSSASGGVVTDVSEGGMALNLLGPPVSDDVLLDLNLSDTGEPFQAKGLITWTKGSESSVGLKFVDLKESSLLQIKRWLANAPVTAELKQSQQNERNEPGTNVLMEAPEAAGSRAIALNHEELDATAQPTELRSIEMTGTKQGNPRAIKGKAVRIPNPSVGLHTEKKEPVTNAQETRALELARSPAVTSDHNAGLLREIKESLAKKSGTAELQQNILVSAGANDAARVKIKTLEAPFTEAQEVHADISNPAPRHERKEPVKQAQETQLGEVPGRASVGILPSDRLFQKKSLAKSSVPLDLEPNVPIQDCGKNGSSVQHRERQLEKIAEPPALGTIGVTKTTPAEADVEEPNAVLFAAPSPGFRTEKKAPTAIEQAVQGPKFPSSLTAASEQGDNLAQTLRTSFAQSELRQVRAPLRERKTHEVDVDRVVLRRWILASVVVFLLIVLLAAARWIYTSPIFDKIASVSDLREMIAGVSSSANGPQASKLAHNVDSKGAERQSRKEKGKRENDGMRPDDPSVRGPRVRLDAQNQRKGLSQVSIAVIAPSALGETNQVFEAQSTGLQTQQQVGTQVRHVSLHAAANLPEKVILPAYPAVAWQKNVQGRVTLKAWISKGGTLRNIRLVGAPSLLSGSVLEAVKKWRYRPRIENGMPVEVETQITIDFER
jgi:TonB family protein